MAYRYENVRMGGEIDKGMNYLYNLEAPVVPSRIKGYGCDDSYTSGTLENHTSMTFSVSGEIDAKYDPRIMGPGSWESWRDPGQSGEENPKCWNWYLFITPVNSGHPNVYDNAGTWKGYLWRNV